MDNEFEKTPLVDLIKEIARLDAELSMKIMRYNIIRGEILRRYPNVGLEDSYRELILQEPQKQKKLERK